MTTTLCDGTREKGKMGSRSLGFYLFAFAFLLPAAAGCRQKMADQPYYRPLEGSEFFADGRASRPLERGVVHRAQRLETDPRVTGLTAEEWKRVYEYGVPVAKLDTPPLADADRILRSVGGPRFDPKDASKPKVYVDEYPFAITQADLKRGQERFTIFCAVCHGPLGNGQGKIWERGYLTPTSFHTKPVAADEVAAKNKDEGLGLSRGYKLWGYRVPMDEAPVGYYFEVITKGYGGMPSYSAQIPADDRWRIIAYIRVLQLSQRADAAKLPPEIKKLLDETGGKK
ncbi:cytochrome c [Gemmata sp. G18]|uniref:Cytochrome c n=1 Tax=Gemmata palustris TaxID=2822762 RepID=A0ABS5BUJ0_9BACT|nr:cytochrome c [Gemmata palustris]MBP3957397.1 cytochrome c [Gemmata palustris]